MITNLTTNQMGTVSFNGKFGKMRKEQDFIVYPISANDTASKLTIQSEHRYGIIDIASGKMLLSANHAQYANSIALQSDIIKGKEERLLIPSEIMGVLLSHVRGTASPMAGNNGMRVFCDNSNALLV